MHFPPFAIHNEGGQHLHTEFIASPWEEMSVVTLVYGAPRLTECNLFIAFEREGRGAIKVQKIKTIALHLSVCIVNFRSPQIQVSW